MLSNSARAQQFNAPTTTPITLAHDLQDPFSLAFSQVPVREQVQGDQQLQRSEQHRLFEPTDEHVFGFFGVDLSPPPCDFGLEPLPEISVFPGPQECVPPTRLVKAAAKPPTPPPLSWETPATSEPSPNLHSANHKIANLRRTIEKMSLRIKELEMMVAQNRSEPSIPSGSPPARRSSVSSNASNSTGGGSIVVRKEGVTDTPPTTSLASIRPSATASPGTQASSPTAAGASSSAGPASALALVGEMEEQWYADRPYPLLKFRVLHKATGAPIPSASYKVEAFLMDGYGQRCDKLGGRAAAQEFVFESEEDGTVEVSNIRFTHVSSKSGGHYTLVVQPLANDGQVIERFESDRITVLSYRLFNARKLDFGRLTPTDPLSKVKGIGSLYAKRFAQLGIRTVADLSKLTTEDNSGGPSPKSNTLSCGQVIENLRKVRGALTRQRLDEYVIQAREVVARSQVKQEASPGISTNKRRRESRVQPHLLLDQQVKTERPCLGDNVRVAASHQLPEAGLPNVFDLPY